jgi:vacuolar-type H+-ATPase subunit H
VETVLEVLDRAEGVLRRHLGRLPAGQRQAIERDVIGLLQMARAALPRELRQATEMLREAESTLVRAREDARRVVLDAQTRARSLSEGKPSGRAPAGSHAIVEEARREAERLCRGADEYASSVLQRLEAEVDRILATIKRGREVLRSSGSAPQRSD